MSAPEGFVRIARLSDIPERRGKWFLVGGEEIAVWRVEGIVYAVNNLCPHQHAPAMHVAHLSGLSLTCPMHGWTFSLLDGKEENGLGHLTTHRVLVLEEEVYVEQPRPPWG
jgi:nitrite reductase/ring-hydroxylating ferredoxin subunit